MARKKTDRMRAMGAEARAAHWRGVLAGQQQSGVTARAFCRKQKIRESAFYYWRRRFSLEDAARGKTRAHSASTTPTPKRLAKSKRSSGPCRSKAADLFAPVTVVGSKGTAFADAFSATSGSGMLEVCLPGDIIVRAPVGTPTEEIGQLVAAVKSC